MILDERKSDENDSDKTEVMDMEEYWDENDE